MNAQVEEKIVVKNVPALNRKDFGMSTHRHREFDADVPMGTTVEDLTKPALWVNVGRDLSIGDEIRVVAEDHSFYAKLLVSHAVGSQVLMKVISLTEFGKSSEQISKIESPFFVELRGRKRWCLVERSTGSIIKEQIASESLAHRDLEDHMRALSN
jgi:hypothetical protein